MQSIELEQAISLLIDHTQTMGREKILVSDASGRILASDICAPMAVPPFDRSPLDGYALLAADSLQATPKTPVSLRVIGEICAGDGKKLEVHAGEAVRIMTGAPMPFGSDCVIRQEDTDESDVQVAIYKSLQHHENYCFAGEDIAKDSLIIKKGERLTYVHMGVLASLGIATVEVVQKVRVGVLSTGDELVEAGTPLTAGKIYASNSIMILQRLADLGMEAVKIGCVGDCAEKVVEDIQEHMHTVDMMITTGGVSVGKKDILHQVVKSLQAERLFWRVKLKPGTPALAAVLHDKLLLCLSGNPFAAITTFELLARPVLAKLSENAAVHYRRKEAVLVGHFDKASKGRRFIRAKYEDGQVLVPNQEHSSGVLYSMVGCNALIDIPAGSPEKQEGGLVQVVLL